MKTLLTKTKFKQGLECPRSLYYLNNKDKYKDNLIDDPFINAMAKGGYQIGELANILVQEKGIKHFKIDDLDAKTALQKTEQYLKLKNVIIYEPAFQYKNCFVRVDILIKKGNYIKIVEVKAKTFPSNTADNVFDEMTFRELSDERLTYDGLLNKVKLFGKGNDKERYQIKKEYESYVYDLAFQAWVALKSKPQYDYEFFLGYPSRELSASIDGLNQKFLVKEDSKGRCFVQTRGKIDRKSLGDSIIQHDNLTWLVKAIHENKISNVSDFEKTIEVLADICLNNTRGQKNVSSACKSCRFRNDEKKNGFLECMSEVSKKAIGEIKGKDTVFDLWSNEKAYLQLKNDKLLFLTDLEFKKNKPSASDKNALTKQERQAIQIEKTIKNDNSEFIRLEALKEKMATFKFPLHFIDFETAMSAIPYRKGQSPYQTIFFQFSHHTLSEDGTVKHAGQFINLEPCKNPNIKAVRALYEQLKNDNGTIFRWSPHENTTLKKVKTDLLLSNEKDSKKLIKFIDSILFGGKRAMVDQWQMYKDFHYLPDTKGSNSIKFILPSILKRFKNIETLLSSPIYGKGLLIESLNFEGIAWIKRDKKNEIIDPYKRLPKVFRDYDRETLDLIYRDSDLKNGGAAMIAYSVCQFAQISMAERDALKQALLRYCELDTFAMVIIYLYWMEKSDKNTVKNQVKKIKKVLECVA